MKQKSPLLTASILMVALLWALSNIAIAQPGPPGGDHPGNGEPPPWAGQPGPPPHAGGDDDEDDDEEEDDVDPAEDGSEDDDIPDFCSARGGSEGPDGQAGMSSIAHLDFSQNDPDTGEALEDGSWGRMTYRWFAPLFDYVFNGHELPPGEDYTLTYQPQPLPSEGVICLGTGTVNDEGDLHLQDAFDIATDLPASYDENEDEAILALVIAADVDCEAGSMNNWDEAAYAFGEEGMFYVHSELEEEEEEDDEEEEEDGED